MWDRILTIQELEDFTGEPFKEFKDFKLYSIKNGYTSLTINSSGLVESLKYNGIDQLSGMTPLSRIYFNNDSYTESESVTDLGEKNFKIEYFSSDTHIFLKIEPCKRYFLFKILDVLNLTDDINEIELFILNPEHVPHRDKAWAVSAGSDALFLNFLPILIKFLHFNNKFLKITLIKVHFIAR